MKTAIYDMTLAFVLFIFCYFAIGISFADPIDPEPAQAVEILRVDELSDLKLTWGEVRCPNNGRVTYDIVVTLTDSPETTNTSVVSVAKKIGTNEATISLERIIFKKPPHDRQTMLGTYTVKVRAISWTENNVKTSEISVFVFKVKPSPNAPLPAPINFRIIRETNEEEDNS